MIEVRQAILALEGVAEATFEEADGNPVGIMLELESGADERLVASEVQTVLSSYGLRSRLAPPRTKLEPVGPPPPPTVLRVTARRESHASQGSGGAIAEVVVRQRPGGVTVAVRDEEDRLVEREARADTRAVQEAVVLAVAELVMPDSPAPGVVLVDVREREGTEIVTAVLDLGGRGLRAGAAVVVSGRELALAAAAWNALTG